MKLKISIITMSVIVFFVVGCAYKLSSNSQSLPGDMKSVQIPLFKNESPETGAEVYFTNSLKSEAIRSNIVKVVNDGSQAEGILFGKIISIDIIADESVIEAKNTDYMPLETVAATQYRVSVNIDLTLKRKNSDVVLWNGNFKQTLNYSAPQITLPTINTANALYNQSAKRQTIDTLSKEMMQAAFDRMLENF